jgi:hypothetical protein
MPIGARYEIAELYEKFYAAGEAAVVTDAVKQVTGRSPRTLDEYLEQNITAFGPQKVQH